LAEAVIAVKTLAAIEAALVKDQGARYRQLLGELMPLAADAYNPNEEGFRSHLGASAIGKECGRAIWYSFRWATEVKFEGRMLRLFNRGHLEEPRMIALMKLIGVTTYQHTADGKQFRMSAGHLGHGGGSLDSVLYGVPDMPDTYMLGEFKTHGEKSYLKLKDEGLLRAKWEHYIQMQLYMDDQKLSHGLYLATNKNTDDIHAEIIQAAPQQTEKYKQRTVMLIDATEPPPKIAKDETDWRCRMCDHIGVCHLGREPHKTCRTCTNSIVLDEGMWGCKLHKIMLTKDQQLAGCTLYDRIA
jgi:hypothetical protein